MQSLFPANAGARGRGRVEVIAFKLYRLHCTSLKILMLSLSSIQAPLLTIKAGKCELEATPNGKFKVTADIRKGQITVTRGSDGLRHVNLVLPFLPSTN